MTRMSGPERAVPRTAPANRASRLGSHAVARALHVAVAAAMTGCIFPPTLSVDNQDAGIDSPPAITSVRSNTQELLEPGPVEFAAFPTAQSVDLTLIDSDVQDTLYVRVFVNYFVSAPTSPVATCTAAPTGTPIRTISCDLTGLCSQANEINNQDLWMEIVVFDRPVQDSGTPLYKAISSDGLSTDRTYQLLCLPSS